MMGERLRKFGIIVGDVIGSIRIEEREDYWNLIQDTINHINKKYEKSLYAPLIILKGDEISAVLNDISMSYSIIRDFQELFIPYEIRFVCTYGEVDVAINTKNASMMDGPGFWKAGEFLLDLKKKKRYVHYDLGDEKFNNLINALTNLIIRIKYEWTDRELTMIKLYEKQGNQNEVAKILGISQQSVSDALRRSYWEGIREAETTVIDTLRNYKGLKSGGKY
jgi:hypothetical protein